ARSGIATSRERPPQPRPAPTPVRHEQLPLSPATPEPPPAPPAPLPAPLLDAAPLELLDAAPLELLDGAPLELLDEPFGWQIRPMGPGTQVPGWFMTVVHGSPAFLPITTQGSIMASARAGRSAARMKIAAAGRIQSSFMAS